MKGRGRSEKEKKNEDFGKEMKEVKKNILKKNEFRSEIRYKKFIEEDESKEKLLKDEKNKREKVKNGEDGVKVKNGMESKKEIGGIKDENNEKKFDFDKIEDKLENIDEKEENVN